MHPQILSRKRMNRDSMTYSSTLEFVQFGFTNFIDWRRLKTRFNLRERYNLQIQNFIT